MLDIRATTNGLRVNEVAQMASVGKKSCYHWRERMSRYKEDDGWMSGQINYRTKKEKKDGKQEEK